MIDLCCFKPDYSNKALLQQAQQEAIPYERRSKITDQKVFTYKKMINEARIEAEKHRNKTAIKPKPAPVVVPPPEHVAPTIGDLFEQLVEAITNRVIEKLQPPAEEPKAAEPSVVLERGWLDAHFDKLTIRKQPVKKRPTVLIIGLNGCQMETIKTYKPDLDYTFATAEQALSHYTFNKDHTILMTKFINHSVQAKYRKHPNLHYCNGGVSELKHMLQIIFHKEYA
jgi:hypothetical protein